MPPLIRFVRPDTGETVSLKFNLYLDVIRLGSPPGRLLGAVGAAQDAEFALDVMPHLVRDHISLRELAGLSFAATEAILDLLKEGSIQIDFVVRGAIEGTHRTLCKAART